MYVLRPVEVPWDLTAHQPFHTVNRYDILRWTLITKNSTYLAYDYENGTPIKGNHYCVGPTVSQLADNPKQVLKLGLYDNRLL